MKPRISLSALLKFIISSILALTLGLWLNDGERRIMTRCTLSLATCHFARFLCDIPKSMIQIDINPICQLVAQYHHEISEMSAECTATAHMAVFHMHVKRDVGHGPMEDTKTSVASELGEDAAEDTLMGSTALNLPQNFASRDLGALIIPAFTSPTHGLPPPSIFQAILYQLTGYLFHQPHIVRPNSLLDDTMVNGECWEFLATGGQVGIHLPRRIAVSHISLNYIHPEQLSPHAASKTPRDVSIWGLVQATDATLLQSAERDMDVKEISAFMKPGYNLPIFVHSNMNFVRLASIRYDPLSSFTWQQFLLPGLSSYNPGIQTVVVTFDTNRGSNTTCVYTVGIHGVNIDT